MLRSKKGISPILATLLLIVIAVAAIIVTYAWVMTYMGAQTGKAGTSIRYENVWWHGTPTIATQNRTDIVLLNDGVNPVKVVRVYLGTSADNLLDVTANCLQGLNVNFNPEKTITITIEWPNAAIGTTWSPATTYYFKIATEPTLPIEYQFYHRSP
jgi:flagellin-like protein